MSSLEGVKAGDTLLLFLNTGGQREKEQTPRVVTVSKVGRTLVHIPCTQGKTDTYRIDDGLRNDGYGHTELKTREGWEDEQKRVVLMERLYKHGFSYNMRATQKPTNVLEAVLKVLDDAEEGEH